MWLPNNVTASYRQTTACLPTNEAAVYAVTLGVRVTGCRRTLWRCVRHCGHAVAPTHHTTAAAGEAGRRGPHANAEKQARSTEARRPYCMCPNPSNECNPLQSMVDDAVVPDPGMRTAVKVTAKYSLAAPCKQTHVISCAGGTGGLGLNVAAIRCRQPQDECSSRSGNDWGA